MTKRRKKRKTSTRSKDMSTTPPASSFEGLYKEQYAPQVTMFACAKCVRTINPKKDLHCVTPEGVPYCLFCSPPDQPNTPKEGKLKSCALCSGVAYSDKDDEVYCCQPCLDRHRPTAGIKADDGKARYDLINPWWLDDLAKVLTQGAAKYGDTNYKNVEDWRYVAAIGRHWGAYQRGELVDPDSGLSHLVHIAANVMFLYSKEQS